MGDGEAYDVFLSYSRADSAAAETLRARLKEAGLSAFLDRYGLPAGQPWQPWLERRLASCRALVVLVDRALGQWQEREIQLGLDRQASAVKTGPPFPVIPVLLPGLGKDDIPVGRFLGLNTWVDLRNGFDEDPEALQRLVAGAQGNAIDAAAAQKLLAGLMPYRGLLPFREQDAGLFFGRKRFVDELVEKVGRRSDTNVVAVVGRSGSGKSSIVYAGLFPALRREQGVGDESVWQILHLRPHGELLHQLALAFDPPKAERGSIAFRAQLNEAAKLFRDRKLTLAELVRDRLRDEPGSTRLLLYVDQWEELYTQAAPREVKSDEDRRRAADAKLFIDLVLEAAAKSPCTLVLSVRSDFYPDLQALDGLRVAVQESQVSLGTMNEAELRDVIEGPPNALGASVESELTKKLIRDIGLDPASGQSGLYDIGKLPLLEYALEQAWAKRTGPRIGLADYSGLEQALEERANALYGRLSADEQAAAKRLFVSLVTPGEGREDTRARIAMPDEAAMRRVVEAFAGMEARLIVTDEAAGGRSVEVSHEALIRHWDKLRAWIDENRDNLRTRAFLKANRAEWLKHGRDSELRHEGIVWGALYSPDGRRILSWSEGQTLRLWDAATGAAIGEPLRHEGIVWGALYSPDGRRILSWSNDKTLRLWDAATGAAIGAPLRHEGPVEGALYSPDGRRILSWSSDKTLRLWDAATGAAIGEPLRHEGIVNGALYAPDGRRILSWSHDKTLRLWDAATGAAIGEPLRHEGPVHGALYSPDGRRILSWSDDHTYYYQTLRLWDAATGAAIGEPLGHESWVHGALYSPDGRRILSWSGDETLRLWDAATGAAIGAPLRHEGWVNGALYSPDGRRILSWSEDGTLRLWDAATGAAIGEPLRHEGWVNGALYSPDGRRILSRSKDGTLRLWDAATGAAIGAPLRHESSVNGALYSPDGRRILSWSSDQTLRLWDAATGAAIGAPLRHENQVTGARYSPDGRRILSWSSDQTLRLWDAATGAAIGAPLRHEGAVHGALYSPDGRRILSWSSDQTLRLWDAATRAAIGAPLRHEGAVHGALYSPDGRRILSWVSDQTLGGATTYAQTGIPIRLPVSSARPSTLRLWDAATGAAIGAPLRHEGPVFGALYSPDGRRILSWSDDHTLRLWDAATGAAIGEPLRPGRPWPRQSEKAQLGRRGPLAHAWSHTRSGTRSAPRPSSLPLLRIGPRLDLEAPGRAVLTHEVRCDVGDRRRRNERVLGPVGEARPRRRRGDLPIEPSPAQSILAQSARPASRAASGSPTRSWRRSPTAAAGSNSSRPSERWSRNKTLRGKNAAIAPTSKAGRTAGASRRRGPSSRPRHRSL